MQAWEPGRAQLTRIALDIAKRLDDERAEGRVRSLLHGVPIIIKCLARSSDHPDSARRILTMTGITSVQALTLASTLQPASKPLVCHIFILATSHRACAEVPEHVQCPADAPFIHRLRQRGLIGAFPRLTLLRLPSASCQPSRAVYNG